MLRRHLRFAAGLGSSQQLIHRFFTSHRLPQTLAILLLAVEFLKALAILGPGLSHYSTDALRQLIVGDFDFFLFRKRIQGEAAAARFCARVLMSSAEACTRSVTCSSGNPA